MKFLKPADGVLTSGFRTSGRPNHHGVDIAKNGTVPIVAAADGTVTQSNYSSSYGEFVMIVHKDENGQNWETVYAHMRRGSREVQVGQRVRQGQRIGYMGNTGDSTGQHLHFEIHRGRWNNSKSNAVNPLNYMNMNQSPTVTPTPPKVEGTTNANLGTLVLPASSSSWRVYPLNRAPVVGNEIGLLNPKKFGGLSYKILGNPQKDVYIIQTDDFGRVQVYAHPSTGARIVKDTTPSSPTVGRSLRLPASSSSWRVYPLNKAPVVGNEVGFLNPKMFGGLTYKILGNPQKDVYIIQTDDFGRVQIYAAPSTGAKII